MRWVVCAALVIAGAAQAGKVHEHGVARLNLVQEGSRLSIELEMPLDTLVGFERAPRTASERQAAQSALARLRQAGTLFRIEAAAPCEFREAEVQAPVLEGSAQPAKGHADAQAVYALQCPDAVQLQRLDLPLFEVFPRLKRLEVQASLTSGQRRFRLTPSNRRIELRP